MVRPKSDTSAKMRESSAPNAMFQRDLTGSMLASWNALFQRMDLVRLMQGKRSLNGT
jgi:hypothetical protein